MTNLLNALNDFWNSLLSVIRSFNFPAGVIDIAACAYVVYHAVRLVRETRAIQLLKGILAILVVYFIATRFNMIVLSFFIKQVVSTGIFILVVLFQPELRSMLERVGRSQLGSLRFGMGQAVDERERVLTEELIDTVAEACAELSSHKTGALIVIERLTRLGDVINTGTLVDAQPSPELICNIFFTNSPLHDGAMVIRGARIHAAGCYLPLSQNMGIARDLGTRHRAALGMSEVSDAVIVIVSEETGLITVASETRLQRGLSDKNLRSLLHIKLLGDQTAENTSRRKFPFGGRRSKKHEE